TIGLNVVDNDSIGDSNAIADSNAVFLGGTGAGNGNFTGQVYAVNKNTAPTITSNGGGATASVNAAENQTSVTTVTATDRDAGDTRSYSIGGADAAKFSISSGGVLAFNTAPNFET